MHNRQPLLQSLADELRTIAAFGLNFARNPHDVERWEAVLAASARITAVLSHHAAADLLALYQANQFAVGPYASGEAVVESVKG